MGWTLHRYFLRRYAITTAWFFLGLFVLIFLVDFTEFTSRVAGLSGYTVPLGLGMSALRVPMVVLQTIPFVALFSAMALLIALNRKYELVIARSAGISAWQFLAPLCIGAFIFGVLAVAIINPIAAFGFSRAEVLEAELRSGKSNAIASFSSPWLRQKTEEGDTIIGARAVLDQGTTLVDAIFLRLDDTATLVERNDAKRAYLRKGYWEVVDVRRFREGALIESIPAIRVPTNLSPEVVQERLARPETIPFYELPAKIAVAQSFGIRADAFSMQFHSLVALPFLLVAMTLIAATVSMRFARLGQSSTMILGGITAGFLLYVVSVLVRAFGNAGLVPPVIAAWIPVLVASFFGITFLLYKEDG